MAFKESVAITGILLKFDEKSFVLTLPQQGYKPDPIVL
jgi:hypothetical protein